MMTACKVTRVDIALDFNAENEIQSADRSPGKHRSIGVYMYVTGKSALMWSYKYYISQLAHIPASYTMRESLVICGVVPFSSADIACINTYINKTVDQPKRLEGAGRYVLQDNCIISEMDLPFLLVATPLFRMQSVLHASPYMLPYSGRRGGRFDNKLTSGKSMSSIKKASHSLASLRNR